MAQTKNPGAPPSTPPAPSDELASGADAGTPADPAQSPSIGVAAAAAQETLPPPGPPPLGLAAGPDVPLDERLRALGLGAPPDPSCAPAPTDPRRAARTAQADPPPAEPERGSAYGRDPIAALDSRVAALSAALAAHRSQLRDAERALVDRIADVDDDRRLTATQLQRAWQAQREEIDRRLRRRGWLGTLAAALIGGLTGAAAILLAFGGPGAGTAAAPRSLDNLALELRSLESRLDGLAAAAAREAEVQKQLGDLSVALTRVSAAVAAWPPSAALPPGPSRVRTGPAPTPDRATAAGTASPTPEAAPAGPEIATDAAALDAETAELSARLAQLEAAQRDILEALAAAEGVGDLGAAPAAAGPGTAPDEPSRADGRGETGPDDALAAAPGADGTAAAGAGEDLLPESGSVTVGERPYALQLIGFFDRADLLAWTARADLPARVLAREETLRGRPWFVVIHSLHRTYAQAEAARDRLPGDLEALGPWIRKLPADATLDVLAAGIAP